MSYFNKLPEIYYNFIVNGNDKLFIIRDITTNIRPLKDTLDNIALYDLYDIVDGETPEIISNKFYGSPNYHWAIMIANQIYDYVNDWPLPYDRLVQYCSDKYGEGNIYLIHHYEDENGYVVNSDYPLATPIDNITYEEKINESKRTIKLVSLQIIQQMSSEFEQLMA
jgi:hypothetical protein